MVSTAMVREIIDVADTVTIEPFIKAANITVTAVLGSAGLTDDQLEEIERWLAAHFLACYKPRAKQEKLGDWSATYQGTIGAAKGLEYTVYGQQAAVLDTSGTLIKTVGKKQVLFKAVAVD